MPLLSCQIKVYRGHSTGQAKPQSVTSSLQSSLLVVVTVPTVSPVKNNRFLSSGGSSVQSCNAPCNPVQEAAKLHSASVVLAPESAPDLSTFILRGCEILFDLITIPTWRFGAGNVDVELLNKKCVRCMVITSAFRMETSRQGLQALRSFYV